MTGPLLMNPTATLRIAAIRAVLIRLVLRVIFRISYDVGPCSIHIFPFLTRISILLLLFSLLVHAQFFSIPDFKLLSWLTLLLTALEAILAQFLEL